MGNKIHLILSRSMDVTYCGRGKFRKLDYTHAVGSHVAATCKICLDKYSNSKKNQISHDPIINTNS